MNKNSPLFNPKATIIDENGKTYQVEEVINEGYSLFSSIPHRSLCFLLCENEIESLSFYINAIERGLVIALIAAEIDNTLLTSLIKEYQPDFIFSPSTPRFQFDGYFLNQLSGNYSLFESNHFNLNNFNSELSLLLSTSGTTGSPKFVRLTRHNLLSNASSISEYLSIDKTSRAISSLPMNYSFGLSIINSHLLVGGSIVLTTESITQRKFWDLFKKYQVTSLSGVPYTFEILKKFRLLEVDLPSLRTITQAGGKLSNDLIQYFALLLQKKAVQFFVMYGQTEGTARLSYLPPQHIFDKLGSIGKSIPNGEFQILDEKGTLIEEPYIKGELIYRGPNVMLGYSNCRADLSKDDECLGTLNTGDIAFFDDEGFYFIVGRIKRFIKLVGNRINLDEIERLLAEQGIESACVGKDNELKIYIIDLQLKNSVKEFLMSILGIHFSLFKIIIVEEIPRNTSGKKLYSKLLS